jgi:hypothetical protein
MYHRHNVNRSLDPECRLCNEADEESSHIIMQCPAIAGKHLGCFSEYYLDEDWAWEPTQLLDFMLNPEIAALEVDPERD